MFIHRMVEITHADPKQLPQFTPEEQTLARDHADSWIAGADLEHVKIVT